MSIDRRKLLLAAATGLIVPHHALAAPHGLQTPPTVGIITMGDSRQGCSNDPFFLALQNPTTGDCGVVPTQAGQSYYSRALSSVPVLWRNMGISGTRLNTNGYPDLVPLCASPYIQQIPASAPFKGLKLIFVNGIGINDLCVGSYGNGHADQYAAACAAVNVSVKSAWQALGAEVLTALETVPPSSTNSLVEANWTQFNSTITGVGWAASNGVDYIIDINSQAQMGAWTAPNDPTLYVDGLHYTTLGSSLFTPIIISGLNTMIGMF
jgi:hypothetical protein